ncbi:MAG: hypothetical protein ABIG84_00420 [archaeon]
MKLESILKDKDVVNNLSSLLEKHTVGGEIEFDDTEIQISDYKAVLNGRLNIKVLKVV